MKKNKVSKLIIIVFMFICIIGLVISIYQIILWKKDSDNTKNQIKEIQKITTIEETQDTENTEIIITEEISKFNPYWDYIKMNLINVNFNELKTVNPETVGWLQVNGTNINYPFVQTSNNNYYLAHSFDKSYNKAGWVFLDYRNNKNSLDKNNIIYAHGRTDTTMFGSLRKILHNGWLENTDNHVIKISSEKENTLWQIFSIYQIPTTNDYIQVEFNSDNEFLEFGNMLLNRSAHNFNTTITASDTILTLSTCYNDTDKVALHAKLIKRETK